MSDSSPSPSVHLFETEGMNTSFALRILHTSKALAHGYAGNCFRQLEELEAELSRYRPDSEVSRINVLRTGDSMLLAEATYRCIQNSMQASAATAGLFDVTLGSLTHATGSDGESAEGRLVLDPTRPRILCEAAGRQIDLGGIGKGFALDEMARTLADLEVDSTLLSAGGSTHLAIGESPWPIELRGDRERIPVKIKGQALSTSGVGEQGAHVVHPDTGQPPDYVFQRVWVIAESAALADAYSTACLLMDTEEIRSFVSSQEGLVEVYAEEVSSGSIERFAQVDLRHPG